MCQYRILQWLSWIQNKINSFAWPKDNSSFNSCLLASLYLLKDCSTNTLKGSAIMKYHYPSAWNLLQESLPITFSPLLTIYYSAFSSQIKHHLYEVFLISPSCLRCLLSSASIDSCTTQISIIIFFVYVYLLWYSVYHNGRDCVFSSYKVCRT